MSKKSVAIIEPVGNAENVFEKYMRLPLLGTLYLGTILDNEGYEARIYNENILSKKIDPFDVRADVYCISALTVSANRALLLAHEIKRVNPKARVIVGGIHASLAPEEFVDAADHVVLGEAESIIVDLIEGQFADKIVSGSPVTDMDALPLVNYSLLEEYTSMHIIPIMTSRGCPFDCRFCAVTKVFGRKFRMMSPGRVIEEIRHALGFFGRRFVFFYDDNFAADRGRIRELCDLIEQEGLDFDWAAQVRTDVARDPELVDRMQCVGCRRFYIGFESINDETLKAMHKSQTRSDIELAIRTFHDHGVSIHGMFIFGEDHDTVETISATVDFAIRHNIDTVQFMILTPFPGTRFYEDLVSENRLIHKRWDYYDGMHVTFVPRNLSPARLQREVIIAYRRFYSLRRLSLDALRLLTDVFVDALTWNFRRVFLYTFETLFMVGGGRFIVSHSAKTFEAYAEFLDKEIIAWSGSRSPGDQRFMSGAPVPDEPGNAD